MTRGIRLPIVAAGLAGMLLTVSLASAQPPGRQTDGMIEIVANNTVTFDSGLSLPFTESTRVTTIHYGSLADLQPGQYVAISASSGPDGVLDAALIARFADGVSPNQGQREMLQTRFCEPGCLPGDSMTNAAIEDARVDAVSGGELTISFGDQSGTVRVTPSTRVELQSAGSLVDITPGANALGFVNDEGQAASFWVYLD